MSKCPDELTVNEANVIREKVAPLNHQRIFFTKIFYKTPYDIFSREEVNIKGKNIILVCGIAKPQPLIEYISKDASDVHTLSYKDHHYFLSKDLEEIKSAYENWNVQDKVIITTEKDAARLYLHAEKLKSWRYRIVVLPIQVAFLFNKGPEFDSFVMNYAETTINENMAYYGQEEE